MNDGVDIRKSAYFRFYAELNDFIPGSRKQRSFKHSFKTPVTVRELLESFGVPLSEVDLVLSNGEPVDLSYMVQEEDNISVYPVFETLDISPVKITNKPPLRVTKFILDAHLGKLAKYLRMLGFDTLYDNDFKDPEIISIAASQHRIILTRDKVLLKSKEVNYGYYVRAIEKHEQLREVVKKFDLNSQFKSFSRCMTCNSLLEQVEKNKIKLMVDEDTFRIFKEFYLCKNCKKVYWKGSHFLRMEKMIRDLCD
ncbi:MAG: Mut7-C ubiquitin/RNAse domain-containing protein [Bacteroidales bacterium]|nr:Mut7-C ubiquitin/RNAse domain-containing protein [Bacteroidales bacterium]